MKYFTLKKITSSSLFLIILISLYFYKIILGYSWLWEDFAELHFPRKYHILNTLKDGTFYFWNPYIFSGVPTVADIQIGLFYPLNLILIPFSKMDIDYMYWLLEMQTIFHLFLGGLFMYLLMRYLKISHFGSLFSAILFSFLPVLTVHLTHTNIIQGFIWFPLIFLFFHKALQDKKIKYIIIAGFLMGISILAAHPQIDYLIFLFLLSYLIYHLITEKNISILPFYINKPSIKKISFFIIFTILSLGIAAVEILPYSEILFFSDRITSNSFAFISSFSLHPIQYIVTSFLPHFFGGQSEKMPYAGDWNYWELVNYIGIIPFFLTITSFIFLRKNKFIKFLITISLVSLTLSFGHYFITYYVAYLILPGIQYFRAPARFLLLYSFSIIIIAGFTLDFILDKTNFEKITTFLSENKKKCKILICVLVFFLITLAIGGLNMPTNSSGIIIETSFPKNEFLINLFKNLATFIIIFFAAIFIFWRYFKQKISSKTFKIAILILTIIDMFWFGFEFNNGQSNPVNVFSKTPEIEYLEKINSADFRIIDKLNKIQNAPIINRLKSIDGYTGPAESQQYKNFIGEGNFDHTKSSFSQLTSSIHRLELLNVCYIISNEPPTNQQKKYKKIDNLNLYQSDNCFNQSFITHRAIIENNPESILSLIDKENFNPHQEIILEKKPNLTLPNNDLISYNDKVEVVKYEPDYIEIKTDSTENGILFLSENYYPGWEASIDEIKTEIYQANYIFRAIELPKGNHIIKFIYNPKIFKTGAIVSVISLICLIISLLYLSIIPKTKL